MSTIDDGELKPCVIVPSSKPRKGRYVDGKLVLIPAYMTDALPYDTVRAVFDDGLSVGWTFPHICTLLTQLEEQCGMTAEAVESTWRLGGYRALVRQVVRRTVDDTMTRAKDPA